MSNTNKKSGFNYEPAGKVYAPNTKIIKHKDGTISIKPTKMGTNTGKK